MSYENKIILESATVDEPTCRHGVRLPKSNCNACKNGYL